MKITVSSGQYLVNLNEGFFQTKLNTLRSMEVIRMYSAMRCSRTCGIQICYYEDVNKNIHSELEKAKLYKLTIVGDEVRMRKVADPELHIALRRHSI